jgi:hypothetical protein
MYRLLLLVSLTILLSSCYEDVEGCLDVNASNYNLEADRDCPDNCCNYPTLRLSTNHLYGGATLRTDTFYRDANDQPFRITRLRYYWSDIEMVQADGSTIVPQREVDIGLIAPSGDTILTTINGNLALFNGSSLNGREAGTIRGANSLSGIIGLLGITDSLQAAAPATAPSGSVLGSQEGRTYFGRDTGYIQLKLEYESVAGSDTLARSVEVFGNQPLVIDAGADFALPRGFNIILFMEADVDMLLSTFNSTATDEIIAPELAQRLPDIFRIVRIEGN